MARTSRTAIGSSDRKSEAKPHRVTRVGASVRTRAGVMRKVPVIVLRGDWLKALGFPIGAPIYVFAEAHRRMAICRLGLAKPRWLHIVAPKRSR